MPIFKRLAITPAIKGISADEAASLSSNEARVVTPFNLSEGISAVTSSNCLVSRFTMSEAEASGAKS